MALRAISVHKKAAKKHPAQGFGKICLMTTRSIVQSWVYKSTSIFEGCSFKERQDEREFQPKDTFRQMEENEKDADVHCARFSVLLRGCILIHTIIFYGYCYVVQ